MVDLIKVIEEICGNLGEDEVGDDEFLNYFR